jgi:hypothetical protein
MSLFTNKIHLGKTKTAQEIINGILNKNAKTASSDKITKTASKKEEEKSSGQLDIEPLHQEGESTPKVEKKKDGKGEAKKASVKKETIEKVAEECETESSGQLEVEPLHQEGESTPKVEKKKDGKGENKKASISTGGKFVKISNLNSEQESYLRKYYSMYYPTEFVDALLTKK